MEIRALDHEVEEKAEQKRSAHGYREEGSADPHLPFPHQIDGHPRCKRDDQNDERQLERRVRYVRDGMCILVNRAHYEMEGRDC